jgi:hypothetical protein
VLSSHTFMYSSSTLLMLDMTFIIIISHFSHTSGGVPSVFCNCKLLIFDRKYHIFISGICKKGLQVYIGKWKKALSVRFHNVRKIAHGIFLES